MPGEGPVKGDVIAAAQGIPLKFLENILGEMKKSGILASQRGAVGGYWLTKPAEEITVADVIRAVEGPLADVRGPTAGGAGVRRGGRVAPRRLAGRARSTSARCWSG